MLSNFFRYQAVENFVEKLEMASGLQGGNRFDLLPRGAYII
jgi:hypothetical protein